MDPEIKRQLEEVHALVKDNHRIVKDIRRHQLLSAYGKFVVWVVLLVAGWYLTERYFGPIISTFPQSSAEMQKLINSYKVKP